MKAKKNDLEQAKTKLQTKNSLYSFYFTFSFSYFLFAMQLNSGKKKRRKNSIVIIVLISKRNFKIHKIYCQRYQNRKGRKVDEKEDNY